MACIELFHYLHNSLLTYDNWSKIYKLFLLELEKVFSKTGWRNCSFKCTPSSLYRFPNNDEHIKCLGMAVSSNVRCFLLTLNGCAENASVSFEHYEIPKELQLSAEDDFFDYIVSCLSEFTLKYGVQKSFLPLGITYDVPMQFDVELEQTRNRFAKAFYQAGIERDDFKLLLTVGLAKNRDLETCKFILVNQSSALLMLTIGLINPKCRLVITEYGAAFIESVDKLYQITNDQKRVGPRTIMELNWSTFADDGLLDDILIEFDLAKGKECVFEKLIASQHRCEMFQRIVCSLVKDNVLFPLHTDRFKFIEFLERPGHFKAIELELIEDDIFPEFIKTKAFLNKYFSIPSATIRIEDCFKIRYVCQSLAKRAAQIIAIILSSWINRAKENDIVIALDQCLYRLKQRYTIVADVMFMLVHPMLHYQIIRIDDDVGVAAAITAGMSLNF